MVHTHGLRSEKSDRARSSRVLPLIEENDSRCTRKLFDELNALRIIVLHNLLIITEIRKCGRTIVELETSFIQFVQYYDP
ncbi:hypothetical protein Agabi119p4_2685 [Agaricus bisporus var. burnettii]|uniref:Uncharacterized protein n=1 Tax=Agaricus bisporus var. burnettii TaxID=192524 RepID=A0A8H7F9Z5_AGABI|nr:hypothetical protein Agabi119p4_2685 [Agaricus bisporus var. burnettii]